MVSLALRQNYLNCSDYETQPETWKSIIKYIPTDKIIYEPFFLNGNSKKYLTELGIPEKNIIHKDIDFYENVNKLEYDIIISNPPFEDKKKILKILCDLDKPFMLLLPISTISKQFFQKLFKNKVQMLIPYKRTNFDQYKKDTKEKIKSNVYFDTAWICYKMSLNKDLIFLD